MIEITNLDFYYKKKRPIFHNITLTLKSGIYGLLGENGVGKTTLLHIISGLRFLKSGDCNVLGQNPAARHPDLLSRLFFVPEEFETPDVSIGDYAAINSPFYPNFNEEEFDRYLFDFQVDKHEKMSAQSFGQKKKAMLAFALALNTPILLLDEPTNGLDIPSKAQFRKVVASVYTQQRCIVISSHQVRDLENLIDPIIILDKDEILINHTIQEISEKLFFSYTLEKPLDSIYCEQVLQGYSAVSINKNNLESVVNLEDLFSSVINNKQIIKEIFKV